MRASEELRQHNVETERLHKTVTDKQAALEFLIAQEPGGPAALKDGKLLKTSNTELVVATEDLKEAQQALEHHLNNEPDPVRSYKVICLPTGEELGHFRLPFEQATGKARNIAVGRAADYELLEQQPDGEWLSFWDTRLVTSGYYFPTWLDGGPEGNRELSEALESLGLEYKQAQLGGASAGDIVDVVVAWISLKDVLVGTASGALVLALEKLAATVYKVVRRKESVPGTRNVVSVSIYDEKKKFRTSLFLQTDEALSKETIQQLVDSALTGHSDADQDGFQRSLAGGDGQARG